MGALAAIDTQTFLIRLGVAALLGFLVGIDREMKAKPLGLRAYMLICTSSAVLCMISVNLAHEANADGLSFDLSRIISGVIGGIGFLGAGSIMSNRDEGKLRGVGSGAAVWGTGVVGIATGFGYLLEAAALAVVLFAILFLIGKARGEEMVDPQD
ncbi:MgtC/SapB family protein [Halovulum sp. GXIMD14793]